MCNDITVHRVVKTCKRPGQYIEPHRHTFFHFIYVLDGHLRIQVGEEERRAGPGMLVMVSPGVEHAVTSLDTSISLDVKFSCSRALEQVISALPAAAGPLGERAGCLLRDILEEAVEQAFGYEDMVNMRLYELLISLMRDAGGGRSLWPDGRYPAAALKDENIRGTLSLIEEHLERRLSVSDLAERCGYSENYFRSYFKERVGMSPNHYISARKIARAKELMLCSNLNVTQIAQRLGYQSIHYFSRQFRKATGLAPTAYASRMRGDRPINIVHNQNTPPHEFELPLREPEPR